MMQLQQRRAGVRVQQRGAVARPRTLVVRCAGYDGKNVVVIGGTGRVGASTAEALLKACPGLKVTIASRSKASYEAALSMRPGLKQAAFKQVDVTDPASVKAAIEGASLVVHTAGPFQRTENHSVLEQALAAKTPYVDVCDDLHYSEQSKEKYHAAAKAAGVPAIISAGIYPGTSNVMAAHIISIARKEYDEEFRHRKAPQGEPGVSEPKLLRYSYYTAGSGGAGPTILETSFLLAGEQVLVYKEGEEFRLPPVSNRREVDFGPGVGRKGIYLYNLPEVVSAYKYLRVPGCSARFGTDPFFWNWAMWLTARLVPRALLNNRDWVKGFAKLSDPFVRTVDKWAGEAVAMKIEVDFQDGKNASGIFVHKYLSQAMGYSVAAFAVSVLEGNTQPGVWYPEEPEALADRLSFLKLAATGTNRFILNRSSWALESEITQLGGLIYW